VKQELNPPQRIKLLRRVFLLWKYNFVRSVFVSIKEDFISNDFQKLLDGQVLATHERLNNDVSRGYEFIPSIARLNRLMEDAGDLAEHTKNIANIAKMDRHKLASVAELVTLRQSPFVPCTYKDEKLPPEAEKAAVCASAIFALELGSAIIQIFMQDDFRKLCREKIITLNQYSMAKEELKCLKVPESSRENIPLHECWVNMLKEIGKDVSDSTRPIPSGYILSLSYNAYYFEKHNFDRLADKLGCDADTLRKELRNIRDKELNTA
jgi:hypothetical protein